MSRLKVLTLRCDKEQSLCQSRILFTKIIAAKIENEYIHAVYDTEKLCWNRILSESGRQQVIDLIRKIVNQITEGFALVDWPERYLPLAKFCNFLFIHFGAPRRQFISRDNAWRDLAPHWLANQFHWNEAEESKRC